LAQIAHCLHDKLVQNQQPARSHQQSSTPPAATSKQKPAANSQIAYQKRNISSSQTRVLLTSAQDLNLKLPRRVLHLCLEVIRLPSVPHDANNAVISPELVTIPGALFFLHLGCSLNDTETYDREAITLRLDLRWECQSEWLLQVLPFQDAREFKASPHDACQL